MAWQRAEGDIYEVDMRDIHGYQMCVCVEKERRKPCDKSHPTDRPAFKDLEVDS